MDIEMSMSTHVVGFRLPDEKWHKMKLVWDTCRSLGIQIPEEIHEFFGWDEPDSLGIMVDLDKVCRKWSDGDMREGLELDVAKIPKGLSYIRFYNSY